jgi:hypothetical protein
MLRVPTKENNMFMNEYDIEDLQGRFSKELPNLRRGAKILSNLKDYANSNSDGWCYWPKPSRAANRLQELLQAASDTYRRGDVVDMTDAELKSVLKPIKAFLTRHGADHSEILG